MARKPRSSFVTETITDPELNSVSVHSHSIPPMDSSEYQERILFTVQQMADSQPALTIGGIREDLFYRRTNGLQARGAVIRRGRGLLLHGPRYLDWLLNRGVERTA